MAKNVVQFQKGLSEEAFRSQYGAEEQYRAALFSWRWPRGFVCPKCAGTRSIVLRTRPIHQCSTCRHQVSLIAGTIFHATKLPLTTWFAVIYHLTVAACETGVAKKQQINSQRQQDELQQHCDHAPFAVQRSIAARNTTFCRIFVSAMMTFTSPWAW